MTPEREEKLNRVFQQRQMDLTLITDRVHKPRNIAALLRNCDAVGVAVMHYVQPKAGYEHFRGTSQGSDRWVELAAHDNVASAIATVKAQGMRVYAAHLSDTAVNFSDVDYTQPCAILMGSEKEGISDEAAQLADQHIIIPMLGMVESFNVSTAAGIILVEAQRQRLAAGMYERAGLPVAQRAKYLFETRYPRIVNFCRLCKEPYPDYTEQGELINPQAIQPLIARGMEAERAEKQLSRRARKRNMPWQD